MEGCINLRTYTQSHTPTVVQGGGGVDWTHPWVFDTLQYFETILPLVESLWCSFYKMRYILLVVALLEVCDVAKHDRHLGSHLGFYQKLNSVKNSKNKQFLRLTCKITKIITLHHFIHKLYFYVWKSWKNILSHSKTAWPPATYDVISRNHSNWSSLNLSQNAREG